MTNNILRCFRIPLNQIQGWRTARKIIVFESDDWGSIRMPSKKVYDDLLNQSIDVESNPFNRFDSLESEEDLEELFGVLDKYKDKNGNPPIITVNFVTANPDFQKIKDSSFQEYYYEQLPDTYTKYYGNSNTLSLIREGILNKFLFPQFHCREHLNVQRWMGLLQEKDKEFLKAFELNTFCIDSKNLNSERSNLMAAYDYENTSELNFIFQSIDEGIKIFKDIFGFIPESFMAPANIWDEEIEKKFSQYKIKYIQSYIVQQFPKIRKNKKVYRKIGQKNNFHQYYLTRNCYFEPSTTNNYDWLTKCMQKIKTAFLFKKPAIISMHRLNFIGTIVKENRKNNLILFDQLLKDIISEFTEVEFIHSGQLGRLIN